MTRNDPVKLHRNVNWKVDVIFGNFEILPSRSCPAVLPAEDCRATPPDTPVLGAHFTQMQGQMTDTNQMSPPSVLYQNKTKTVVVLDLPRSIEEAQLPASEVRAGKHLDRRLISAPPPDQPFPTPEPKHGQLTGTQGSLTSAAHVAELMTLAAVESALDELQKCYAGPWCLPRVLDEKEDDGSGTKKRKMVDGEDQNGPEGSVDEQVYIPPGSHYLRGTIQSARTAFINEAPNFDLIILDPPWPNRSARRKKGNYTVAYDLDSIRDLLSSIPVAPRLSPHGLVAVWVTNAGRFTELLTAPVRGIFAEWGLELIDEWTWLKVTSHGEPIVRVDSTWRKPWERLLIARRIGSATKIQEGAGKVIVSVPDVHSRKPNLRGMFEGILGHEYTALEVFARSLTAGWWGWGDDVLRFQKHEYWRDIDDQKKEAL
jgi:N6-adenosine-specific RNA methylase IME4